jgi:hypothetical protein
MNCDLVFDVLTRGPFPTGHASDAAMERHLAACHECRQLAAALEPAVYLFHEALSAGEESELPGYRGVHSESHVAVLSPALRAALEDESLPYTIAGLQPRSQSRSPFDGWRLAAVLSLGPVLAIAILATLWVAPQHWPAPFGGSPLAGETGKARFQPSEAGRELLKSLSLPAGCFDAAPVLAMNNAAVGPSTAHLSLRHDCCLKCHGDSSPARPSLDATAMLDRSCRACHEY